MAINNKDIGLVKRKQIIHSQRVEDRERKNLEMHELFQTELNMFVHIMKMNKIRKKIDKYYVNKK